MGLGCPTAPDIKQHVWLKGCTGTLGWSEHTRCHTCLNSKDGPQTNTKENIYSDIYFSKAKVSWYVVVVFFLI